MVMPTALPRFDLLQFEALILSQISGHLTVCLEDDLVNTATGVPSYVCQLGSCFIDNGRYLGDLLGRQIQFPTEPVPHSAAHYSGVMMKFEKKAACVHFAKERARHSTRNEDEEEAGNQFPLQRAIHGENSS
jgi:hypothetical protein